MTSNDKDTPTTVRNQMNIEEMKNTALGMYHDGGVVGGITQNMYNVHSSTTMMIINNTHGSHDPRVPYYDHDDFIESSVRATFTSIQFRMPPPVEFATTTTTTISVMNYTTQHTFAVHLPPPMMRQQLLPILPQYGYPVLLQLLPPLLSLPLIPAQQQQQQQHPRIALNQPPPNVEIVVQLPPQQQQEQQQQQQAPLQPQPQPPEEDQPYEIPTVEEFRPWVEEDAISCDSSSDDDKNEDDPMVIEANQRIPDLLDNFTWLAYLGQYLDDEVVLFYF
jgi:hypothetical protein